MLLLLIALAAPSQDEACAAPCHHTTCRDMSALGMNCGHLESLGCQCEGCCMAGPPREPPMPSAPPPVACDHACLASTCGALRHTLHCEEIEELNAGCECGNCCDPNPSRPPPSPATPSTASSMASLGKMISHTAKDRAAAGDFSGYVLAVVLAPFNRFSDALGGNAFDLLGKVPFLKEELPRYMIFGTAAAALLYFLLHWATDLGPGQHVAIMLACVCPAAVLVCAVTACSCGAKDEADAKADPLLPPSAVKAKAKGVSVMDVTDWGKRMCWSEACDKSGLSFCQAAFVAAAKLVL